MSLTISGLTSGLNKHLAENPTIFGEKMVSLEDDLSPLGIMVYSNVEDEMPLYELDITDPGQAGNRATENVKTGVVNWKNRVLTVKPGEVTLKFTNQQINALWKTHLNQIRSAAARGDMYEVPFESVIMDRIVDRLKDRIVKTLLWGGSYNATGTTTASIADGWNTKLAADDVAEVIATTHVFAGAGITANNAIAQHKGVLDLVAATASEYLDEQLVCYTSPENKKFYNENYRATHGALPYNQEFQKTFLEDNSNIVLHSVKGLSGSDRVVISTPGNFVVGTDSLARTDQVTVEKRGRDLYIYIDFKIGMEYILPQEIWMNDQA